MTRKQALDRENSSSNDTIFLDGLTAVFGTGGGVAAAVLVTKEKITQEMEDGRDKALIEREHQTILAYKRD